jgi:mono/diheme cytochrome c family protein
MLFASMPPASAQGDAKRGAYLAKAAGCQGCHTEAKKGAVPYAGGRGLKTPFGTFYGPNITPHPGAGIGRWREADFLRALRSGMRPDGAHYYPAFPYPSFTAITDSDARDLWAFFRALPPDARPNRAHELKFPFDLRFMLGVWKWMYFSHGPFVADASRPPAVNRGAYVVNALAHCGECHTPRNLLGGVRTDRRLAGARAGADGKRTPNLTPARLKGWSDADLREFLLSGISPDGDIAAETMAEVIRNTTSKLTPEDLSATIAYLRTLPAVPDERP